MKTSAERTSRDVLARTADTPRTKQLKDVRQKRLNYFNSLSYVLCSVLMYCTLQLTCSTRWHVLLSVLRARIDGMLISLLLGDLQHLVLSIRDNTCMRVTVEDCMCYSATER